MEVVSSVVDHARVVNQLRRTGDWALQLAQPYLKQVQNENLSAVNEALNELYVEDEDYESLRSSIDSFNNYNPIAIASQLATHELLEFRRISSYVYRKNKKWNLSIELSKNDKMWKDSVDTANESEDPETIENLLRYFCDANEKECFAAGLYTCYSHISPDVALELGWVNGYQHFIMPFFIQNFRQTHLRLLKLETVTAEPEEEEAVENTIADSYLKIGGGMGGVLMLENGGMGGMPAPGMPTSPMNGMGGMGISPDMSGFASNGGMPVPGGMSAMPPGMGMPGMMPAM